MIGRLVPGLASLVCLTLMGMPACAQQAPADARITARTAWRSGDYDRAVSMYRRLTAATPADPADVRALVLVLLEIGKGDDAVIAARQLAGDHIELQAVLGEALRAVGQRAPAESAFARAIDGKASDQHLAAVGWAELLEARGDRRTAWRLFEGVVRALTGSNLASADDYVALGTAYRYLGGTDPQLFRSALQAFDRAIAVDSSQLDARIRLGELFLEKYNAPDAAATFREVLAVNPRHARALLGLARHTYFDGGDPTAHLDSALATNPSLLQAMVLRARVMLDREDYRAAEKEAERVLAIDAADGSALAMLAASQWLRGDAAAFEATKQRVLLHHPRNGEFFADLAEAAGRNRFYREAATFATEGVALDSTAWRTLGQLGINQLRIGAIEDGRRNLERAFAADPFNVWHKNTLDLLDQLTTYPVHRSPRFAIYADSSEVALLAPYAASLAEEAYDLLATRYQYRPPTPIRLEIYRSHADFSVRTVGLAGLGALGVSFGTVLAMDSPAARNVGDFNWGSTLWHEIAHTFTLGVTDHRVPRWLSEGLSVLEERRARPAWGANATLGFIAALKGNRLLPVSRLNDGFVRPTYAGQVQHSYYEASLVCEYIAERWGDDTIRRLLAAFREGSTVTDALQRVLDVEPDALDRAFDQWLRARFARELPAVSAALTAQEDGAPEVGRPVPTRLVPPGDFVANLRAGQLLFEHGSHSEAAPMLERAKTLFPDYAEANSPYWFLAQIAIARGDTARAVAELQELVTRNESAYVANRMLAGWLEERGDIAGAAEALDRTIWIRPGDRAVHTRLAELSTTLGQHTLAVRERRAILSTDPVDRADAEYQLALALRAAGDPTEARRAVLRALEIAPAFVAAQTLLLALRRGGGA